MRKNFGAKPYTYPQPVFIIGSFDENGVPDAMNAAWGGISDDTQLSLCLSAGCRTDFADIQNKKECGGNRQWQNHYLRNWAANTKGKGII